MLNVITEDGSEGVVKYQMAEVSRPLNAVSDICDAGNRVIFGRNGGVILNLSTGKKTYFHREDGIYVVLCWVKPYSEGSNDKDFHRQPR